MALVSGRLGSVALPVVKRPLLHVLMSCIAILNAGGAFIDYINIKLILTGCQR